MPADTRPSPPPTLHGRRCTLRPPLPGDEADRLAIGRHAEFVLMSGGSTRDLAPLTPEEARAWYQKLARERYAWVIEVAGRGVGTARLNHVDDANRAASFAIGIFDPALWNRGLGTEATRLVLGFAFDRLGLHRVGLVVLEVNQRVIRAYERSGFRREGVIRDSVNIDGAWHSDVLMGILEDDYRAASAGW